jgi:hypothetical protein
MDKVSQSNNQTIVPIFKWQEFVAFLMGSAKQLHQVGPAWCLLLDICMNADRAGTYPATYSGLAKRYGVAIITVKKWRSHLCNQGVIESFSRGHSVVFRLNEPFISFLTLQQVFENGKNENVMTDMILKALKDQLLTKAA